MRILAFSDYCDLIYRNIRDLVILIFQIQHAAFYINHVSTKRGVGAASDIDLLTEHLF